MRRKKNGSHDGILNIDGYSRTQLKDLKLPKDYTQRLSSSYHKMIKDCVEGAGGKVWQKFGDGLIASWFPCIDHAVGAALDLQNRFVDFNKRPEVLSKHTPVVVRIGVALGSAPDVPLPQRGEGGSDELNVAGHLQKVCPPGRVLISSDVFSAMNTRKVLFRPGPYLKEDRIQTYVSRERCIVPDEIAILRSLTEVQRNAFPLLAFPNWKLLATEPAHDLTNLGNLIEDAFVVLGETRDETKVGGSPVSAAAATSDAVGAIEILATVKASPQVCAGIDEWTDTEDRVFSHNVVVVGSPVVNLYAYAVNCVFSPSEVGKGPVGFEVQSSVPLRISIQTRGGRQFIFPPRFDHTGKDRHYGLAVVFRSPFSPKKSLCWIAGITGMATQAVARFVHDMIWDHKDTLQRKRANGCKFVENPNVAVVAPAPAPDFFLGDYAVGGWRVAEYKILWLDRIGPWSR